jgi:hypothetical protein
MAVTAPIAIKSATVNSEFGQRMCLILTVDLRETWRVVKETKTSRVLAKPVPAFCAIAG